MIKNVLPHSWVLALVLGATVSCRASHPLALPGLPPTVALAATDPAAYPGLPAQWHRWVGVDLVAEAPAINWAAHLDGESAGVHMQLDQAGLGCLFEMVHRVGELERRWFVLIEANAEKTIRMQTATMTTERVAEPIPVPLWFSPARVSVAPAGKEPSPARNMGLPIVAPRLGYSVGIAKELTEEFQRREDADEVTDEVFETYAVTTTKPVMVLLSLFLGIQGHEELSTILRQLVDAPNVLRVILSGGLEMNLDCDTEKSLAVQHTLVDGRQVPGVTFPAHVSVNGDLALELEVFAIESVDPVRLVGGLIGLRAYRPSDESESVMLTLIGAGTGR